MAARWGEGKPFEMLVWELAEKFGWTLEYVESLPMAKIHEYLQIQDGMINARQ